MSQLLQLSQLSQLRYEVYLENILGDASFLRNILQPDKINVLGR